MKKRQRAKTGTKKVEDAVEQPAKLRKKKAEDEDTDKDGKTGTRTKRPTEACKKRVLSNEDEDDDCKKMKVSDDESDEEPGSITSSPSDHEQEEGKSDKKPVGRAKAKAKATAKAKPDKGYSAEVAARKKVLSIRSSAYRQAYNKAKGRGLDDERARAAGRAVTWVHKRMKGKLHASSRIPQLIPRDIHAYSR